MDPSILPRQGVVSPRLERVLLPARHEFEVTVPDGKKVHGYVTSYEVWDSFIRVVVALIDRPLERSREDALVLRLENGTFAKMVHGGGRANAGLGVWETSFERPPTAQTATLGFGRDRRPAPDTDMLFTPIMDLPLP